MNNYGQVGILVPQSEETKVDSKFKNVVWEPQLVYPTAEIMNQMELENLFDFAKQIEIFEDSSFLVTEDGALFSWGRNDHQFLGRDAKLDAKMMNASDKRKKLTFSTSIPGRVAKLDRFSVQRIAIKEGKVMCFFVEAVDNRNKAEQDSEVDSEEEKDVVEDIANKGVLSNPNPGSSSGAADLKGKEEPGKGKKNKEETGPEYKKQNTSQSNKSMSSNADSKMMTRSSAVGNLRGNRVDKDQARKWQVVSEIIKRAIAIKEELTKFDRALADSVKPLTDLQDKNIYH